MFLSSIMNGKRRALQPDTIGSRRGHTSPIHCSITVQRYICMFRLRIDLKL